MRKLPFFLILVSVGALGCGDDGGDDGDTDASSAQGSSSSGAGGGGSANDNDCSTDGYVAATSISFGGELGTAYDPRCVSIGVGDSVTWSGDFAIHPLRGGYYDGSMLVPDASSPIDATNTGMELTTTFPAAGVYPFYCDFHGAFGMTGAVKVE